DRRELEEHVWRHGREQLEPRFVGSGPRDPEALEPLEPAQRDGERLQEDRRGGEQSLEQQARPEPSAERRSPGAERDPIRNDREQRHERGELGASRPAELRQEPLRREREQDLEDVVHVPGSASTGPISVSTPVPSQATSSRPPRTRTATGERTAPRS